MPKTSQSVSSKWRRVTIVTMNIAIGTDVIARRSQPRSWCAEWFNTIVARVDRGLVVVQIDFVPWSGEADVLSIVVMSFVWD